MDLLFGLAFSTSGILSTSHNLQLGGACESNVPGKTSQYYIIPCETMFDTIYQYLVSAK